MAEYVLPELRYDYAALAPHLSGQIVEIHHDKHHRLYVEGANQAIEALDEARESDEFDRIAGLERALAFNVSGHVLHSLYWQNLSPDGGDAPGGDLGRAIERDFGSFERFRSQLTHVASTIMGSGWAALVFDPVTQRLLTTQIHDHQSGVTQGGLPLMVIDAWEHAWYLQYRADKKKYFEAIWNLWDWEDIGARFAAAQSLDLLLTHAASDDTVRLPGDTGATLAPDERV